MSMSLSPSSQKVQDALTKLGISTQVTELLQTTRSAAEAATALDCEVGQIAKSIIFEGLSSGMGILVIASGSNKVKEDAVSKMVGEQVKKADPQFVRDKTGFAIGGVSPIGHCSKMKAIIVDEDLLKHNKVWTAGGTPNSVFSIYMHDLLIITGGIIRKIK